MPVQSHAAGNVAAPASTVDRLEGAMRGDLVRPGHPDYDRVRTLHNALHDRYPALIARCRDVADVIAAVGFARESGLPLAIRGGGHSAAGHGSVDDGLMLDLSLMKGIRVDPDARTVRVEAGCTWSEVDHATHAFGLAVPSGSIGSTGVAGLTLGGGIGHLTRRHGLTIDNLLSADIVLADGALVTVSEGECPDLFWAIRGGGGNFGVITSFLFRAHPLSSVVGGPTFWTLDQAPEVLRWYREFIATAPESLNGYVAFVTIPPAPPFPDAMRGTTVLGIFWCHSGPVSGAEEVFAPIRTVGPPVFDGITEMPYPAFQGMFDALVPPGMTWYSRAHFVRDLPDAAIDIHLAFAGSLPTPLSTMHLYPVNGAVHRVGRTDTAFSYRDATWAMLIVGVDPGHDSLPAVSAWAEEYWEALKPFALEGAYVNMLMDEGEDRVRAAYRDNYPQLQAIKQRYDPGNLFHINQNIRPTGVTST